MKTLTLAKALHLPLDAVSRTFGILAVRGAGKSNTAAVMAEEMFAAGLPFVVIDPVGSWYGLRSSADGSRAGLSIPIFGGKHGDVPLERGAGELLADLVVEKRLTCVLDLSRFDSEADKKAFLIAFAKRLYLKNENPLHLFLEEADDYIPQSPMGDEKLLLRAWENIVRRGRARGLGMTLITQRSAAVAKMVLTQVETLFAMRTTGPQDIAAIEAWVKYHQVGKDVLSTLASLEDGEAWVWSPHYLKTMSRHQIRRRQTFDSGATPQNVRAKDTRPPATLADIDLAALQERMAATIEKAKADDPRELRKRITDLERQLKKSAPVSTAAQVVSPPQVVEKPVITDAQLAKAEAMVGRLEAAIERAGDLMAKPLGAVRGQLAELVGAVKAVRQPALQLQAGRQDVKSIQAKPPTTLTRASTPISFQPGRSDGGGASASLPPGELATLTAALQYPDGLDRKRLGILTGYKRSSRDAYIQRLQGKGLVQVNGPVFYPTDAGRAALNGSFEPLPTGAALIEYWQARLPEGERKTLDVLIEAGGQDVTRETIDEATGYKRSSRDAYLQRLKARGLVDMSARGMVHASDVLFEEA